MDPQEKDEIKIETRESRIDCQIKNVKAFFNPDAFFDTYTNGKVAPNYLLSEYGGNHASRVVRHYLWLSIKLMALYVAKWVNWLFYHR